MNMMVTHAGATSRRGAGTHACHSVRSNCNAHGECIKRRSWCVVRRGVPAWLLQRFPQRWATEQRPAYLFGRTDLLNPTHIASLHFLPLMRWMDAEHMQLGQVLAVECHTSMHCAALTVLLAGRLARSCGLAAPPQNHDEVHRRPGCCAAGAHGLGQRPRRRPRTLWAGHGCCLRRDAVAAAHEGPCCFQVHEATDCVGPSEHGDCTCTSM